MVDVLNGLLALVTGGQIEVNVRPLFAILVEETLEEQVHLDGIDGGDLKRVADDGVCGAAAALNEDVVVFAIVDDVPDDEEVPFKAEALDKGEFTIGLDASALHKLRIVLGTVATSNALSNPLAQITLHRVAFRHGIAGKLVAEIVQLEVEALREQVRVGDGFRKIVEELCHGASGLKTALRAAREQSAGVIEIRSIANAGEEVEDLALFGGGVTDAVGGEERQAKRCSQADGALITCLLLALRMALQFDVDVGTTEETN